MDSIANWNGKMMPLADVRISALDRGYLFGEGIYEVMRVYNGVAWRAADHYARLASGLKELEFDFDAEICPERVQQTLKHCALREALVYIQITRQSNERHHAYPSSPEINCLIFVQAFDDPFAQEREEGVAVTTFPDIRWRRNDIKASSLVANCMAAQAASKHLAFEALLVRDGLITEGSHSSVFAVMENQLIVPPSSNSVLPGITKRQVLELCQARQIKIAERQLLHSDLPAVDELFLTATPEEIIGIIRVDDQIIGDGKPGPITRSLHNAFRESVARATKSAATK